MSSDEEKNIVATLKMGEIACRRCSQYDRIAMMIATCCFLSPLHNKVTNAYTPSSMGISRFNHRGIISRSQKFQLHQPALRTYHRSSNACSRLFSTSEEEGTTLNATMIQGGLLDKDTTNVQKSNVNKVDEGEVFDNLLPSTMASTSNSRLVSSRRATGLSSSVLLPLSESTPNSPLFQSTNTNQSFEYDNSPETKEAASWKERLVDVSNLASLLCVLDCTLLPLVSIAIPALSWGLGFVTGSAAITSSNPIMAGLSSLFAYLPALSHGIALYFVIPVGLLTTIVNYFFGHKEVRFSLLSIMGVALIFAANSSSGVGIPSIDSWLQATGVTAGGHVHGGHVHDACGAVVGAATGMMAHTCPEGLAHRMTNTLGCAFLLGSNYAGRKYVEEKSQGCAASALAEAWGGDSGGKRVVCPPGCNCEAPSYGATSRQVGGETFFQWERTPGGVGTKRRGNGARRIRQR